MQRREKKGSGGAVEGSRMEGKQGECRKVNRKPRERGGSLGLLEEMWKRKRECVERREVRRRISGKVRRQSGHRKGKKGANRGYIEGMGKGNEGSNGGFKGGEGIKEEIVKMRN